MSNQSGSQHNGENDHEEESIVDPEEEQDVVYVDDDML